MGELALIEQIRLNSAASSTARSRALTLGIGDDCAILRPPPHSEVLVTTDFTLEGRHFRRDLHSPESVGHRCLARGLSDLAAMGAICDVYDAITSDRPYKKGWEPVDAIRKMAEWQEGHFDREIFHTFVKMIGIYPTGTLVRLQSDRLAVVLTQGRNSTLTPIVRAFRLLPSNEDIEPVQVDLEEQSDAIVGIEDPSGLDINMPALLRA